MDAIHGRFVRYPIHSSIYPHIIYIYIYYNIAAEQRNAQDLHRPTTSGMTHFQTLRGHTESKIFDVIANIKKHKINKARKAKNENTLHV